MTTKPSSFNYEEILSCGRGELFGPGNAQLPLPPMLMVHRITDISETGGAFDKGYVRAEYDVRPDDWYFRAILPAIRSCQAASVSTACGS